jgi:hypothetical protein
LVVRLAAEEATRELREQTEAVALTDDKSGNALSNVPLSILDPLLRILMYFQ